jgi:hypothetical protein
MAGSLVVAPGVVIEPVGDDVVALLPHSEVITLTGLAADAMIRLLSGQRLDASDQVVQELLRAGVVEESGGVTRRHVVRLGAVAAGAGVASLALPSVAQASSVVTLEGSWHWIDYYQVALNSPDGETMGFDNPTWVRFFIVDLPESFNPPVGTPSSLQAVNQQFNHMDLFGEDSENPIPAGSDGVLLFSNLIDTPTPLQKSGPLEGTITGSFTWAGHTYQVTFTQTEDQPILR